MASRVKTIATHLTAAAAAAAPAAPTTTPSRKPQQTQQRRAYRYTSDEVSVLTKEERDFYEQNGYLVKRGLLPQDRVDYYVKRADYLAQNPDARPQSMMIMRDVSIVSSGASAVGDNVSKIWDYYDDKPGLMDYTYEPVIQKFVEGFCGPHGLVATHTMLIKKMSDNEGSSVHPLHCDCNYFPWRSVDKETGRMTFDTVVASWTALEHITEENGCLLVVPGSHKCDEILEHGYPDLGTGKVNINYVGILGTTPDVKTVSLRMAPGDTVFFHPMLFHGSLPNLTKKPRYAISCHFASSECKFVNVTGSLQDSLEKESREMARIIFRKRTQDEETVKALEESFKLWMGWQPRIRVVKGDKSFELPDDEEEEEQQQQQQA